MIELDKLIGIALTLAIAAWMIFIISKWRFFKESRIPKNFLIAAFVLKLMAGFMVGFVYSKYYTDRTKADTFKYFDDSAILFSALHEAPYDFWCMISGIGSNKPELSSYYNRMNHWYDIHSPMNDNRAMIRLNACLRLFSLGHYHVHVVIVCMLSFIGMIAATRALAQYHPDQSLLFFLSFVCVPSVLFWTSGLLKDSLTVFALGLTLLSLASLQKVLKPVKIVGLVVCLWMLANIRFQFFLLMVPITVAWLTAALFNKRKQAVFMVTFVAMISGLLASWGTLFDTDFMEVLSKKREAFIALAKTENSNSLFSSSGLDNRFPEILAEPAAGFWHAITQPSLQFKGGVANAIVGVETLAIGLFLCFLVIKILSKRTRHGSIYLTMILTISISYLSVMGMVTPIAGALVRYKALMLPFVLAPLWIASGLRPSAGREILQFLRFEKRVDQQKGQGRQNQNG